MRYEAIHCNVHTKNPQSFWRSEAQWNVLPQLAGALICVKITDDTIDRNAWLCNNIGLRANALGSLQRVGARWDAMNRSSLFPDARAPSMHMRVFARLSPRARVDASASESDLPSMIDA